MNLLQQITKSVNVFFDSIKGDNRLYLEGQDMDMAGLDKWAELRVTGPRIQKTNKIWFIEIDVNIMCSAKPNENIYLSQEIAGAFAEQMDKIPVTDENNNPISCFTLRNDVPHQLDILQWGRVDVAQITVIQTSLEAFYRMEIAP